MAREGTELRRSENQAYWVNAMTSDTRLRYRGLLAALQLLAAIANSDVANVTNQLGTALANLLPDRVGLDVLRYNYTQGFLPGLITAATGISYEPCLIAAGLTGAVLGDARCSPSVQTTGTARYNCGWCWMSALLCKTLADKSQVFAVHIAGCEIRDNCTRRPMWSIF